jgi:hypothetical protein
MQQRRIYKLAINSTLRWHSSLDRINFAQRVENFAEIQPLILESKVPIVLYISYRALKSNSTLLSGLQNKFQESHKLGIFSKVAIPISENKNIPSNEIYKDFEEESSIKSHTKSKIILNKMPENYLWRLLFFEPDDISAAKKLFNMKKLPCAYLFCYGNIIDCKLISSRRRSSLFKNRRVLQNYREFGSKNIWDT